MDLAGLGTASLTTSVKVPPTSTATRTLVDMLLLPFLFSVIGFDRALVLDPMVYVVEPPGAYLGSGQDFLELRARSVPVWVVEPLLVAGLIRPVGGDHYLAGTVLSDRDI